MTSEQNSDTLEAMFFQQNLVKILLKYILDNGNPTHQKFRDYVVNLGCFNRINYFWWRLGYLSWHNEKFSRLVDLQIGHCKEHKYFKEIEDSDVLTIFKDGDKFLSFSGFVDEYRKRRARYFHLILWILGSNILLQVAIYIWSIVF